MKVVLPLFRRTIRHGCRLPAALQLWAPQMSSLEHSGTLVAVSLWQANEPEKALVEGVL